KTPASRPRHVTRIGALERRRAVAFWRNSRSVVILMRTVLTILLRTCHICRWAGIEWRSLRQRAPFLTHAAPGEQARASCGRQVVDAGAGPDSRTHVHG